MVVALRRRPMGKVKAHRLESACQNKVSKLINHEIYGEDSEVCSWSGLDRALMDHFQFEASRLFSVASNVEESKLS